MCENCTCKNAGEEHTYVTLRSDVFDLRDSARASAFMADSLEEFGRYLGAESGRLFVDVKDDSALVYRQISMLAKHKAVQHKNDQKAIEREIEVLEKSGVDTTG